MFVQCTIINLLGAVLLLKSLIYGRDGRLQQAGREKALHQHYAHQHCALSCDSNRETDLKAVKTGKGNSFHSFFLVQALG